MLKRNNIGGGARRYFREEGFACLFLVLSIFIILMLSGWLNPIAPTWFLTKIAESQVATNVTVGVCVVLILLAMKCIFFSSSTGSDDEENLDNGILLENADGKLFITKETIKNIALNVICGFEGAIDPKVELEMDKQNQVKMNVIITAKELSAINQLSKNIQVKVKEVVKKTTDLELQAVNVAIRKQRLTEKEEKDTKEA